MHRMHQEGSRGKAVAMREAQREAAMAGPKAGVAKRVATEVLED